MEQVNPQDLKSHDRRPPRPSSSSQNNVHNPIMEEQPDLSKTTQIRKNPTQRRDNSSNKKNLKIQSYVKSKKESVSSDVSNSTRATMKSTTSKILGVSSHNMSSTQSLKRGNSQGPQKSTVKGKKCAHDGKPAKKKKVNKLKERIQKQKQLDLEEQLRNEEEELRQRQLLEFRLEQEKILTEEERQRLLSQYHKEEEFLLKFENQIFNRKQHRIVYDEWVDYLNCTTKPNPDKENTMTQFLYIYGEKNEVNSFDMDKILQKADYSESIIDDLQASYLNAQADNKLDKMRYYQNFIQKIRNITQEKFMEITAYIMKNQQKLVEEKNKIIQEKGLTLLNGDNIKKISQQVLTKQELRPYYELQKEYISDKFKFGIWINPLTRCGYRIKPIVFKDIGTSIEIPRTYNDQLVMTCIQQDECLESQKTPQKYDTIGPITTFKLYKFLPLPLIRSNFTMVRTYTTPQDACYELYHPQQNFQGTIQSLTGTLPLPQNVHLNPEEIQIGYLNQYTNQWVIDNEKISIQNIDFKLQKVHFSANLIRPFAILKKKQSDFPFKSWFLRQNCENKALLDIESQKGVFRFEFDDQGEVMLRRNGFSVLEDLFDLQMEGGELLIELNKLGFNFLPSDYDFTDENYKSYQKHSDVENKALQEIIFSLPSFMIKSEGSGGDNGENNRLFFSLRENLEYKSTDYETDEFQWKKAAIWYNKCGLVSYKNQDEIEKNTQTHASLQLVFQNHSEVCNGDVNSKIENMLYPQLQNNVRRFMKLTRLVSFT